DEGPHDGRAEHQLDVDLVILRDLAVEKAARPPEGPAQDPADGPPSEPEDGDDGRHAGEDAGMRAIVARPRFGPHRTRGVLNDIARFSWGTSADQPRLRTELAIRRDGRVLRGSTASPTLGNDRRLGDPVVRLAHRHRSVA